jgi:lysozyme family protein
MFTEVLKIKSSEVGHIHPEVAGAHKRIGNVHYQRGDLNSAAALHNGHELGARQRRCGS